MKICFPIDEDIGLESKIYGHFGSAPQFIVVDTETRAMSTIKNIDQHHAHGACQPIKALGGQNVEAIVVGGIGAGALRGLNQAGLTVYKAFGLTIADSITCLAMDELPILTPGETCGSHGHAKNRGGACQH